MKQDRMTVEFAVCYVTRDDVAMVLGDEGLDETTAMSIAHALTNVEMKNIADIMSGPLYVADGYSDSIIHWLKREKKIS